MHTQYHFKHKWIATSFEWIERKCVYILCIILSGNSDALLNTFIFNTPGYASYYVHVQENVM